MSIGRIRVDEGSVAAGPGEGEEAAGRARLVDKWQREGRDADTIAGGGDSQCTGVVQAVCAVLSQRPLKLGDWRCAVPGQIALAQTLFTPAPAALLNQRRTLRLARMHFAGLKQLP